MNKPNFPKQKSSRVVIGFGVSVIIYTVIIVIFGPLRGTAIPYLVDCSGVNCDFTNLGSSILEVSIGVFIAILVYKLQTDSSKKLAKVKEDVTEKVYSRNVREYTCDFQLDEVIDKKSTIGEIDAEDKVMKRAAKFIENIENGAISFTDSDIPGRGQSHIIEKQKGTIEITLPKIRESSKAGGTKSVNLHLRTTNLELLDDTIKINKHPYWDFQWLLDEKYDVHQIMNIIEEKTGKGSFSSSGSGTGENIKMDRASYHLARLNEYEIVITISTEMISVTCIRSPPNGGIFRAHKLLNPGKLVSILFGEKTHPEIKQIAESLFKQ